MHNLIKHLSIFTWMDILQSNERAISFAEYLELIPRRTDPAPDCPKCFGPMNGNLKSGYSLGWVWSCKNGKGRSGPPCYGSINSLQGTFFEGSKLPMMDVLGLMFGYIMKVSYSDMLVHMNLWRSFRKEKVISQSTVMKFYTKFDEIILFALSQRDKNFKRKESYDRVKLLKKYALACKIHFSFQNVLFQFLIDLKFRYPCFNKDIKCKTVDLPPSSTSSVKDSSSEKSESSATQPASSSPIVESENTNVRSFSEKSESSDKTAQPASSSSVVGIENFNLKSAMTANSSVSANKSVFSSRCGIVKPILNENNLKIEMSPPLSTRALPIANATSLNENSTSNSPSTCVRTESLLSNEDISMVGRNVITLSNITAPSAITLIAGEKINGNSVVTANNSVPTDTLTAVENINGNSVVTPNNSISTDTLTEKIKLSDFSSRSTAKRKALNKNNIENDELSIPSVACTPVRNTASNCSSTCVSTDETPNTNSESTFIKAKSNAKHKKIKLSNFLSRSSAIEAGKLIDVNKSTATGNLYDSIDSFSEDSISNFPSHCIYYCDVDFNDATMDIDHIETVNTTK